ncbi:MAG: tyrosine-type recombinase/integrase [Acidimicrobiales bacterium]
MSLFSFPPVSRRCATPTGSTGWHPACREAGLPGLDFHDLRSMAATAMVEVGTKVKTGQKRMGHSSSKVFLDILPGSQRTLTAGRLRL